MTSPSPSHKDPASRGGHAARSWGWDSNTYFGGGINQPLTSMNFKRRVFKDVHWRGDESSGSDSWEPGPQGQCGPRAGHNPARPSWVLSAPRLGPLGQQCQPPFPSAWEAIQMRGRGGRKDVTLSFSRIFSNRPGVEAHINTGTRVARARDYLPKRKSGADRARLVGPRRGDCRHLCPQAHGRSGPSGS